MPFFSIISPVFNTEKYLETFLNSVLSQSFRDFELILVDDGSQDDSLDICIGYADKDRRIRVFTQQNQGAGAARNKGIKESEGKYLLFFDSDDWIEENGLQFLADEMKKSPDGLLIYGSTEVKYNEHEEKVSASISLPINVNAETQQECRAIFCDLIFTSALNVPWNKVYSRTIVTQNHIEFPDTRRAQDAFFNMEYYKHIERVRTVQKAIYYYRENTQNKIWKKFPKDLYKIDIQYDEYLVNIFQEFEIYSGDAKEKVDTLFFNSIFRTVGFYKNPLWKMSRKEKTAYVKTIIEEPYNQERAKNAMVTNSKTARIKKLILDSDARGFIRFYEQYQRKEMLYTLYSSYLKRLVHPERR